MLSCHASQAQDTSKLTAKAVYEDVKQGFTKLVNTLEGPAKHTYEIYVRQQRIEGWSYLAATIFILLVTISLFVVSRKAKWGEDDSFETINVVRIIGCAGFVIFIGMMMGLFAGSYLSQIINSEYWAIKEIVKSLT